MNLQLSLKKKWFEMTKSGIKTEDYRELSEYWLKRLCISVNNVEAKHKNAIYILCNYIHKGRFDELKKHVKFKSFETNTMTLGYPKKTDKSKISNYEHAGIEIRHGKEEWGAEKGKFYFVIKHGNIIN